MLRLLVHGTSGRFLLSLLLLVVLEQTSHAALMLTTDGANLGFTLTTFATGFPSASSVGPLGIGFNTTGGVIVSDGPGNVRVFPSHADGQNIGGAVLAQNTGAFTALGIAQIGSTIYMATHNNGGVVQLNQNGTIINPPIISGVISAARDIVVNPLNNHLLVSGNTGIWDVDPIAKTATRVVVGDFDGLSVNNSVVYAAHDFNHISGFSLANFGLVFSAVGPNLSGVDGTALGFGAFSGKIFANTNLGRLVMIDLANPSLQTIIASGGSRGDFVKVDPLNNTLLVTQTDSILRLTAPTGSGFGDPSATNAPEPPTAVLVGASFVLAMLWQLRWRFRPAKSI